MPQLEDTPRLVPKTAPAFGDLLPIYDVTEVGNARNKKSTLAQVASAGISGFSLAADDAEAAGYGVAVGSPYVNSATYVVTIRSA